MFEYIQDMIASTSISLIMLASWVDGPQACEMTHSQVHCANHRSKPWTMGVTFPVSSPDLGGFVCVAVSRQ